MYLGNILVFYVQHVSAIIISYHQAMKTYATKENFIKPTGTSTSQRL